MDIKKWFQPKPTPKPPIWPANPLQLIVTGALMAVGTAIVNGLYDGVKEVLAENKAKRLAETAKRRAEQGLPPEYRAAG